MDKLTDFGHTFQIKSISALDEKSNLFRTNT